MKSPIRVKIKKGIDLKIYAFFELIIF